MRARAGIIAIALAACGTDPVWPDGGVTPPETITITATVESTRFETREHMLAAGEMQISGEPLAEAMGRDLGNYSRAHLPTDLYFDTSIWAAGPWVDLAGFSTGVESYEYSKQPMNGVAFEYGAGTALVYAPLVDVDGAHGAAATAHLVALVQHFAASSNALGRYVFPAGTFPRAPMRAADNPLGWPGIWPTVHPFRSFDPASSPTSAFALRCSISSDDDPGQGGSLNCADYECDATSLHVATRNDDSVITPGADGFTTWKYGLWVINYLQIMHDDNEASVDSVPEAELALVGTAGYPVHLGSSDLEGFQAQMFLAMADSRADDWLLRLTTADGATLSGFATIGDALHYTYASPLRWFPGEIAVTEADDGGNFPMPAYALHGADSSLLDALGMLMGYAEVYALTDTANRDVGGSQPVRAMFDGDPFPGDDQLADGEATLHDRALAVIRVAMIDLDRLHTDPVSGVFVDQVAMTGTTPMRSGAITTESVAFTLLALRTVQRALSSQLQLYSNNTPDTAIGTTPLDALPIAYPGNATLTLSARIAQLVRSHAELLYGKLTDGNGNAFASFSSSTGAEATPATAIDPYAAAVRGLFAAYLATGDVRFKDRAIAVFDHMEAAFYHADTRLYSSETESAEFTPLRFALIQSSLRDMYELVAARPGGEDREPVLEERLARLNKLVLDGWDDRNGDRLVEWPDECVNVVGDLPRGGLQMAERTLTGEIGIFEEHLLPGKLGTHTSDRESDCVPEIDDAGLPAALADKITFHVTRSR